MLGSIILCDKMPRIVLTCCIPILTLINRWNMAKLSLFIVNVALAGGRIILSDLLGICAAKYLHC